ncbi:zinc ribbon domain-containing protein [Streptomyces chiangmaiensis]
MAESVVHRNPRRVRPSAGRTRRIDATYLLAGLLCCGVCNRRMESHWTHHRPGYRCRLGHASATHPEPGPTPNTCLPEDHVLPRRPPYCSASPARTETRRRL